MARLQVEEGGYGQSKPREHDRWRRGRAATDKVVVGDKGAVVTSRIPAGAAPDPSAPLELVFAPSDCHVFDAAGERMRIKDEATPAALADMPIPLPAPARTAP